VKKIKGDGSFWIWNTDCFITISTSKPKRGSSGLYYGGFAQDFQIRYGMGKVLRQLFDITEEPKKVRIKEAKV